MSTLPFTLAQASAPTRRILPPVLSRGLFLLVIASAAFASILADLGTTHAVAQVDVDLTRLLRLMALVKAAMAAVAVGATFWRLRWPISPVRFGLDTIAGAMTVTGPGLIWGMDHVGLGALLLHAGLAAMIALIWRDPAVWTGMDAILKHRAAPSAKRR